MNATATMRKLLAQHFRSKAAWRSAVGEERCREGSGGAHKNEMYAHNLEQVANYVESLPDDDPTLQRAATHMVDESGWDRMHADTIHCSVRQGEIGAWFSAWIESAIDAAAEEAKDLSSNDFPPSEQEMSDELRELAGLPDDGGDEIGE